jgi:hypothetical protein
LTTLEGGEVETQIPMTKKTHILFQYYKERDEEENIKMERWGGRKENGKGKKGK